MLKNTIELEAIMREILIAAKNKIDVYTIFNKYGKNDGGDALAECIKRGYILDIQCDKNANDEYIFQKRNSDTRIHPSGMIFLEKFKS